MRSTVDNVPVGSLRSCDVIFTVGSCSLAISFLMMCQEIMMPVGQRGWRDGKRVRSIKLLAACQGVGVPA
jgi:hypothetical protein